MPNRNRSYCFTVNNPSPMDRELLNQLGPKAKYMVVGEEVGESGTPHLQGYVQMKEGKKLVEVCECQRGYLTQCMQMAMALPRGHIEVAKGSPQQNMVYCKKEGKFQEWGVKPSDGGQQGAEDDVGNAVRNYQQWLGTVEK